MSAPHSRVVVHLRPEDNIAVAARHLAAGQVFEHQGRSITVAGRVGLGHKVALVGIRKGEAVLKYGQVIGFAACDIAPG